MYKIHITIEEQFSAPMGVAKKEELVLKGSFSLDLDKPEDASIFSHLSNIIMRKSIQEKLNEKGI